MQSVCLKLTKKSHISNPTNTYFIKPLLNHKLQKKRNKHLMFSRRSTYCIHPPPSIKANCNFTATGKILETTISDASRSLWTNRLPVCFHPLLAARPELNTFTSEGRARLPTICPLKLLFIWSAHRVGRPFAVVGQLEPLCVSRLIHLLTLVVLDLKTHTKDQTTVYTV